jgi:hypothetical protein
MQMLVNKNKANRHWFRDSGEPYSYTRYWQQCGLNKVWVFQANPYYLPSPPATRLSLPVSDSAKEEVPRRDIKRWSDSRALPLLIWHSIAYIQDLWIPHLWPLIRMNSQNCGALTSGKEIVVDVLRGPGKSSRTRPSFVNWYSSIPRLNWLSHILHK